MNALRADEVDESESLRAEFAIRSLLDSKFHLTQQKCLCVEVCCFWLQFCMPRNQFDFQVLKMKKMKRIKKVKKVKTIKIKKKKKKMV